MARPSPFPGMDPWLQRFWGNVHNKLCTYVSDSLNDQLAPGLVAVTEQRVFIENDVEPGRYVCPDVHLVERPWSDQGGGGGTATAAAATSDEPTVVEVEAGPVKQPYIEIVDANSGGTVVTVIEVVSPSNRRLGEGRDQYLKKQAEVAASSANLVEVDLIRGHRGVTLAWKHSVSIALEAPYHACARRASRRTAIEVYPIPSRRRLPSIRIPLRAGEADVRIDLQTVMDDAYRRGRMAELIDYARPPEPPLDEPDLTWAAEQIAAWRGSGSVA